MFGIVNNPLLAGGQVSPRPALVPQQGGPLAAYAQMLEQGGLLPPQRQQFQPSAAEQAQMRRDMLFAMGNNLAKTLGADTEYVDPYAAQDQLRKQRQGLMDEQWGAQVARAKALREVTSDDLVAFMLDQAGGKFKGSFAEWQAMANKGAGGLPAASIQEEMLLQSMPEGPEKEAFRRRISPQAPSGYTTSTLTNQGVLQTDARTGAMTLNGMPVGPEVLATLRAPAYDPGIARDVAAGKGVGTGDAELANAASTGALALEDQWHTANSLISQSEALRDQIAKGQINTGPIEGFLLSTIGVGSEELSAMSAQQVEQQLKNLQIVNLAPVTVKELEMVARMWADISKNENANIGALDAAIARTQRLQAAIERGAKQRLREARTFGGKARFDNLLGASPWLQSQWEHGGNMGASSEAPPADVIDLVEEE